MAFGVRSPDASAGTVPTLVVPLQKTLAADIESRYKAIQDSKVSLEPEYQGTVY